MTLCAIGWQSTLRGKRECDRGRRFGLTKYRLAKDIGVPAQRIGHTVAGKRAITADTDLRLCRFFGLSNGYWLRAQVAHDTEIARETLADELKKIKPWSRTAA